MHMVEGVKGVDDGFEDVDQEEFDEVEYVDGENAEKFLCIVQRLLLAPREPIVSQRHHLLD